MLVCETTNKNGTSSLYWSRQGVNKGKIKAEKFVTHYFFYTPNTVNRNDCIVKIIFLIATISVFMSTNLEKRCSGGYAFEVGIEDIGCKSPSSGKPKHVFERLGDSVDLNPEDLEQKLKSAEERRKAQESDKVKKVQEHNARVERISKEGAKEEK